MADKSYAVHNHVLEQVEAIRSNDEAALQQLYQANFHKVESFVLNNNGSSEEARDIYQDAFIAVWRNIQLNRFEPRSESALDGYLFQVAKNKWMDHLRSGHYNKIVRMKDAAQYQHEDEAPSTEEDEYLAAVKKYFPQLGDNCKKILALFYYENESMKQIAESMGWTEATAKNNKYRCIQKLKELINSQP